MPDCEQGETSDMVKPATGTARAWRKESLESTRPAPCGAPIVNQPDLSFETNRSPLRLLAKLVQSHRNHFLVAVKVPLAIPPRSTLPFIVCPEPASFPV